MHGRACTKESMLVLLFAMRRCLEQKTEDPDMSKECKAEVVRVMNEKAKDYRLNYRLTHACEQDIPRLCDNVCSTIPGQICGGLVLQCLQVGLGVAVCTERVNTRGRQ